MKLKMYWNVFKTRIKTYEKFDSESIEDENALSRLHEAYYWLSQKRSKRKKELADKLAML